VVAVALGRNVFTTRREIGLAGPVFASAPPAPLWPPVPVTPPEPPPPHEINSPQTAAVTGNVRMCDLIAGMKAPLVRRRSRYDRMAAARRLPARSWYARPIVRRELAILIGVAMMSEAALTVPAQAAPAASGADSATPARALSGPWTFRRVASNAAAAEPWLPATVPGCVHTDLFANGKIGDPFYRLNEKDQQWIEHEGWEYRTTFRVDAETRAQEHVELVFQGLDTYAEVFLNGVSVLWATNMFRTWRISVKGQLTDGDNVLVVRFRSPISYVKSAYDHLGYRLPAVNDQAPEMVSMFTRKAPYHYGWDWGPRFVTSGIWRPVTMEAWSAARLDDVQLFQDRLDAGVAELTVKARVVATSPGRARVQVSLPEEASAAPAEVDVGLKAGINDVSVLLRIEKPERWWPNGLGPQRRYTLETRLTWENVARGVRRTRIGLRTIEVMNQRDNDGGKPGKSFTIKVNGAPVFMKGANWVPADSFLPRVTEARYRALLESAAAVHMNMIRVWGGGVYEDDRFYELCDELGLLVWQDFMFACSMYPGDAAFVENVHREAVDNIRRIRNHPSLALWAGNNEIEAAWQGWGWAWKFGLSGKVQEKLWNDYQQMFHVMLPAVVAAEDPGRFYTRSSPSADEDDVKANKLGWGDMHYWGVWHAEEPYTKYAENTSRFMSEYGFQSFPELSTVARYTVPGDWDIASPVMSSHQRHPRGNQLINTYLQRDFRKPKDFASFLYVGQVLQATVIRYAAEAHRRQMGHNWGSLYWQLDDCWPVASWSGIDYFGRWKALHYAARRFFAPVLVSPVEEDGTVKVWAISDRRTPITAHLSLRLLDFNGNELWRHDQDARLGPNASHLLATIPRREALAGADPKRVVLVAELTEAGKRLSRNTLSFLKTKDLELPTPELHLDVEPRADGTFAVRLLTRRFARDVMLSMTTPAAPVIDGFFDDNDFDLFPGEAVTVVFHPGAPTTLEAVRGALRAISLTDSY
jgi:beta-mannosidase